MSPEGAGGGPDLLASLQKQQPPLGRSGFAERQRLVLGKHPEWHCRKARAAAAANGGCCQAGPPGAAVGTEGLPAAAENQRPTATEEVSLQPQLHLSHRDREAD